jgi:hypothetical protein
VPPNSRDQNYHRGFPGRTGFDKGHAMSHAQGGREGGPNYFRPASHYISLKFSPQRRTARYGWDSLPGKPVRKGHPWPRPAVPA